MKSAGLAIAALLVVSFQSPARSAETDVGLRGKGLVEEKCARCHATGKDGDSPHKEAPPFRTFASLWPLENLEEALAEGIVTGHADMPAFVFEPDEIDAILEYLHSLNPDPDGTKAQK